MTLDCPSFGQQQVCLELAGIGPVGCGGSFQQLPTETTPAAPHTLRSLGNWRDRGGKFPFQGLSLKSLTHLEALGNLMGHHSSCPGFQKPWQICSKVVLTSAEHFLPAQGWEQSLSRVLLAV